MGEGQDRAGEALFAALWAHVEAHGARHDLRLALPIEGLENEGELEEAIMHGVRLGALTNIELVLDGAWNARLTQSGVESLGLLPSGG